MIYGSVLCVYLLVAMVSCLIISHICDWLVPIDKCHAVSCTCDDKRGLPGALADHAAFLLDLKLGSVLMHVMSQQRFMNLSVCFENRVSQRSCSVC